MDGFTVGEAAERTGWSPRMLRYLEHEGLSIPSRSASGYRLYRPADLNQLRSFQALRRRFGVEIGDLAFAARLYRERPLREAVERVFAGTGAGWVEWEQRKHERLLAA